MVLEVSTKGYLERACSVKRNLLSAHWISSRSIGVASNDEGTLIWSSNFSRYSSYRLMALGEVVQVKYYYILKVSWRLPGDQRDTKHWKEPSVRISFDRRRKYLRLEFRRKRGPATRHLYPLGEEEYFRKGPFFSNISSHAPPPPLFSLPKNMILTPWVWISTGSSAEDHEH